MEEPKYTQSNQSEIVCSCGAKLTFAPGKDSLKCEYCGNVVKIEIKDEAIEEVDFLEFLQSKGSTAPRKEVITIKCNGCGAATTFDENVVSSSCAFCGTPLVAADKQTQNLIEPKSLLPFAIEKKKSIEMFREWLKGLWFAPSQLAKYAREGKIDGVYLPYWTYDSDTFTNYTGERGDDYQDTETYTDSDGNEQTRTVTKTNWYWVNGTVRDMFDDILVVASKSLPEKYIDELEPWDLEKLVPYDNKFLSGFRTESYQVDLEQGFDRAKEKMEDVIDASIRRNIGGDHQRIHTKDTHYNDITFKHILLPLWISAYKYNEKVYRFMVNARTGEVKGERPYSVIKIVLAILAVLAVIALIIYFTKK